MNASEARKERHKAREELMQEMRLYIKYLMEGLEVIYTSLDSEEVITTPHFFPNKKKDKNENTLS